LNYLGFVPILPGVFRPQNQAARGVGCEGRGTCFFGVRWWPVVALLGSVSLGCVDAPTPTGPAAPGTGGAAPAVTTFPDRDTTVDSIGLMPIEVIVHDQNRIFTVTLELSGVAIAFPADTVNDTAFDATYAIALGALRHRPFGFRVEAQDVLGRDTVTDSVHVRLQ